MLRITPLSRDTHITVLKVEGWIAGRDIDLLDRELTCAFQKTSCVILNFDGIRFIDLAGIKRLCWSQKHLSIRGGSPFIRIMLKTYGLDG